MTSIRFRIDKAYCIEAGAVFDILQARDFYFSREPQKRLNFLCSDPECRIKGVVVTGVCYDKPYSEREEGKAWYRNHKPDDHQENCEWAIAQAACLMIIKKDLAPTPNSPNACKKFKNALPGDVIDIYKPGTTDVEVNMVEDEDEASTRVPTQVVGRIAKVNCKVELLRKSYKTTSQLRLLVKAYILLVPGERKSTLLKLAHTKKKIAYQYFFRHIEYWNPSIPDRISYATIERIVHTEEGLIRIYPTKGVKRTNPPAPGDGHLPNHLTWIELNKAMIRGQRGWKTFLGEVEACSVGKLHSVYVDAPFISVNDDFVCHPIHISRIALLTNDEVIALENGKKK